MTWLLEVEKLSLSYHRDRRRAREVVKAVDQVSFALKPGQTLALVGESGCGKSSLARTLLRLHQPDSGAIRFKGQDISRMNSRQLQPYRQRMQMVFQDPMAALNPRRTIYKTLREPLDFYAVGKPAGRHQRVSDLLAMVGLSADLGHRYPHEFSGGQRQRICIARALAAEPDLIIADEAVSALDVSVQAQILNLFAELQTKLNISLLFISHDLAVVQHIADYVGVMYAGQLVEFGRWDRIYQQPQHPYTRALLQVIPQPDPAQPLKPPSRNSNTLGTVTEAAACRYALHCNQAMPQCFNTAPAEYSATVQETAHRVSCHLYAETH